MCKDYLLAFSQLNDPRLWKPVLWAILLSLGSIFITMALGGAFLLNSVNSLSHDLGSWMSWADGWLGGIAALLGTFFIGVLGYFFLANVYAAYLGIFLDDALDAVQLEHYPDREWNKPPGIIESCLGSIRFIIWSLFVYILAAPFLFIGYFIPPVGIVLQFLLGGYLLGREFGQLIELRLPKDQRLKKPGSLMHGTFAIILWSLPVVNLLAPLLLAVSLVHCRLRREKNLQIFPR